MTDLCLKCWYKTKCILKGGSFFNWCENCLGSPSGFISFSKQEVKDGTN